jgi:hypothetical protein
MVGVPKGKLFREPVIRFSLPPLRGGKGASGKVRRPLLPYHRFTAGDVIAITGMFKFIYTVHNDLEYQDVVM